MAVQTKQFARISAGGVVQLLAFMEYDDADYLEINDDGDPADFAVVRWYGTNFSDHGFTVTTFKANGGVQWSRTVPAGESFSVNAGGAVKYESDIPRWVFG